MKTILSILLLTLPVLFFAQDVTSESNRFMGVSLGYDNLNGLQSEFRFDKRTSNGYIQRVSFFTNFNYSYGVKVGMHKAIVKNEKFDLDLGFNLRVTRYTSKYLIDEGKNLSRRIHLGYEVPLEMKYHLNSDLDLNLGISIIKQLRSNDIQGWNYGISAGASKRF